MADDAADNVPDQEVQRVLDSIDGLGVGGSAEERARRLTALLDQWPDTHTKVREMRKQAIAELWDDGNGLSYREIGTLLKISYGRVRQILADESAGPVKRAKEKKRAAEQQANVPTDDDAGQGATRGEEQDG